jgi:hypothetical protein
MPGWMLTAAQLFFGVMAVCAVVEWRQIGHGDRLARAFEFAASAGVSLALGAWWPLIVGVVLITVVDRSGLNRV